MENLEDCIISPSCLLSFSRASEGEKPQQDAFIFEIQYLMVEALRFFSLIRKNTELFSSKAIIVLYIMYFF